MRVVYTDESGVGSEEEEPLTVVAGLILDADNQWHRVLKSIETALADYVGKEKVPTYEIRGRVLYHKIKRGDAGAAKLMASLMRIPSRHLMPIFFGAVHREGFKYFKQKIFRPAVQLDHVEDPPIAPDDAFRKALVGCMEKVEAYAHIAFPSEQILWIHDKGKYDEYAKGHLKQMRYFAGEELLREFYERRVGATSSPSLSNFHIIDTIYFGNSQESRALQLADVCCSTITRHLRSDPIAAPYYKLLLKQMILADRPQFENVEQVHLNLTKQHEKKKRDHSKA